MTRRRLRPWVIITLSIIFLSGVIYSSYKTITWKKDVEENEKIEKDIEEDIKIIEPVEEEELPKYQIDFESLKEKNADTVAYLKVNNTNIDYVIVKGKDNSYYLKHNFEKKWNSAGWVFADYHNKFDETDKNIVIYGHSMKNGSMFGTLRNILNKDWYKNEENYKVVLVTENGEYSYRVFSIYSIVPEDYYINTIFKGNQFAEFVKKIKSRSIYNFNVEVTENDKILTLSSCTSGGKKRVVLHAKLIED